MKNTTYRITRALTLSAFTLGAAGVVRAQYSPPPPPAPFAGFLNEYLRKSDPYMNQWDIAGAERVRFEDHEGYSIAGVSAPPTVGGKANNDFRASGADVYNDYWLSRLRFHI